MSNQKVRKLIIPVAGMGTRLLPATKAQPKEMMPILDKPIIQYIVEEAVRAGIEDIILVTGSNKRSIEDHFDRNENLENYLLKNGKKDAYESIKHVSSMANFIYVRQKGAYGTGTPVLNAKHLIGDEPFAVVYGDDIFRCPGKSHLAQLIEVYERYGDPVITARPTDKEGTKKYGIIEGVKLDKKVYEVKKIMEKPGPDNTDSRLASLAGYILTPDVFLQLETMPHRRGREFYLVDAIDRLMKKRPVYASLIDGEYYDTGSKLGWLMTNIEFALMDKELSPTLKRRLTGLLKD